MNYFQNKQKKNLNMWIREMGIITYVVPNKRNKIYLGSKGFVSHRAMARLVKDLMKGRK